MTPYGHPTTSGTPLVRMAFNLKSPTVGRLDGGTHVKVLVTKHLPQTLALALALALSLALALTLALALALTFTRWEAEDVLVVITNSGKSG